MRRDFAKALRNHLTESVHKDPSIWPIGPIYCALHRFNFQVYARVCFLGIGSFKPGEKWVNKAHICDENARVVGEPGY